jgi:hypothetical protein
VAAVETTLHALPARAAVFPHDLIARLAYRHALAVRTAARIHARIPDRLLAAPSETETDQSERARQQILLLELSADEALGRHLGDHVLQFWISARSPRRAGSKPPNWSSPRSERPRIIRGHLAGGQTGLAPLACLHGCPTRSHFRPVRCPGDPGRGGDRHSGLCPFSHHADHRLHLVGLLVGPYGLGSLVKNVPWLQYVTISNPHAIEPFAEFGIILLLFEIGLELSFNRLWAMRRLVFGLGAMELFGSALLSRWS